MGNLDVCHVGFKTDVTGGGTDWPPLPHLKPRVPGDSPDGARRHPAAFPGKGESEKGAGVNRRTCPFLFLFLPKWHDGNSAHRLSPGLAICP